MTQTQYTLTEEKLWMILSTTLNQIRLLKAAKRIEQSLIIGLCEVCVRFACGLWEP